MRLVKSMAEEARRARKSEFSRAGGMLENARKGSIVAAAVTASAVFSCIGDGPTGDGGSTAPEIIVPDSGTHDGGDGGSGGGFCSRYGEGSPNRITFSLGQEVRSGDGSACISKLIFKGISGDTAEFGMYAPPQTYPVGYWGIRVGEEKSVFFKGVGWTFLEPCAMTSSPCNITIPVGTKTGDVNCTVTLAGDRPWVP
jgi:hypothetical protein